MARRARVYGKQKINDLSSDLQKFSIASPAKVKSSGSRALVEIADNPRGLRQGGAERWLGEDAEGKKGGEAVEHGSWASGVDVDAEGRPLVENRHVGHEITTSHDAVKALTSLDSVLDEVEDMRSCFNSKARDFNIEKIAEGSYASILRLRLKDDPSQYSICKLMPIKFKSARRSQYDYRTLIEDAVAELKILSLMSVVPGFVNLCHDGVRVLQGIIPPVLQQAFDSWEHENPDEIADSFDFKADQYWLLLEMVDAGTDLGALLHKGFPDGTRLHQRTLGARLTPYQTWDIFWGVAEALAAGEDMASFEHRDLHLNNICIKRKGNISADDSNDTQILPITTRYTDLEVTLIDYTLSRASFGDHETLANSMQDEALFNQESTATEQRKKLDDQHQYDTYNVMRQLVLGEPRHRPKNTSTATLWKRYVPTTNLLWLHHLLFVLLRDTQKQRKAHLDYVQDRLIRFLRKIRNDLDPEKIDEWVYRSAKDLVNEERAAEVERREISLSQEFAAIRT